MISYPTDIRIRTAESRSGYERRVSFAMKKVLCLLVLAGWLLSLTACSINIPTKAAEEEMTRDRTENRTTKDAGDEAHETAGPEETQESSDSGALFPIRTSEAGETGKETLPAASETEPVPETPSAVQTSEAGETVPAVETTQARETLPVMETTAVRETTAAPETSEIPETTAIPETEKEAETTELPEETTPEETEPVILLAPGDILSFGHYEQDGISSNGKEEIQWIVLYADGEKALLLSRFCLDCVKAHNKDMNVTWENSDIRKWLSGSFMNTAFTAAEQAFIRSVRLENKANPKSGYGAAGDTEDRIFLLSVEEVETYLSGDMFDFRGTTPTRYAMDNGSMLADNGNTWWWLRTTGRDLRYFAEIYSYREFDYMGDLVTDPEQAVRPAVVVDLNGLISD